MKILTVVFSLEKGGTERVAQNFAKAYRHLGHDSRVIFTQLNGQRSEDLIKVGVPVYCFLDNGVLDILRMWGPELIHIHSHGLTKTEFNAIKSISGGARIVETNVFSKPSAWEADLSFSFQLSSWCESLYLKRGGDPNKTRVIPNAVDVGSFSRASFCNIEAFKLLYHIANTDIVLGRVGQCYDGKWSTLLISVFENLKKDFSNLKLILVNPPESIVSRVQVSKFKGEIILIDSIIGDDQLALAYSAMDIFVHIADQGESFGMTLAEALLCETPVVTYATPWADNSQGEIVGNALGGYVAGSPKDFELLLRRLMRNKSLCIKLGKNGRSRVIEKYNSLLVARSVLEVPSRPSEPANVQRLVKLYDIQGVASYLTKIFLWLECGLSLIRYSSGYQPWIIFFKTRLHLFFLRVFKNSWLSK